MVDKHLAGQHEQLKHGKSQKDAKGTGLTRAIKDDTQSIAYNKEFNHVLNQMETDLKLGLTPSEETAAINSIMDEMNEDMQLGLNSGEYKTPEDLYNAKYDAISDQLAKRVFAGASDKEIQFLSNKLDSVGTPEFRAQRRARDKKKMNDIMQQINDDLIAGNHHIEKHQAGKHNQDTHAGKGGRKATNPDVAHSKELPDYTGNTKRGTVAVARGTKNVAVAAGKGVAKVAVGAGKGVANLGKRAGREVGDMATFAKKKGVVNLFLGAAATELKAALKHYGALVTGTSTGAIAGTLLIPVPVLGTVVGAAVGHAVGSLAGSAISARQRQHTGAELSKEYKQWKTVKYGATKSYVVDDTFLMLKSAAFSVADVPQAAQAVLDAYSNVFDVLDNEDKQTPEYKKFVSTLNQFKKYTKVEKHLAGKHDQQTHAGVLSRVSQGVKTTASNAAAVAKRKVDEAANFISAHKKEIAVGSMVVLGSAATIAGVALAANPSLRNRVGKDVSNLAKMIEANVGSKRMQADAAFAKVASDAKLGAELARYQASEAGRLLPEAISETAKTVGTAIKNNAKPSRVAEGAGWAAGKGVQAAGKGIGTGLRLAGTAVSQGAKLTGAALQGGARLAGAAAEVPFRVAGAGLKLTGHGLKGFARGLGIIKADYADLTKELARLVAVAEENFDNAKAAVLSGDANENDFAEAQQTLNIVRSLYDGVLQSEGDVLPADSATIKSALEKSLAAHFE